MYNAPLNTHLQNRGSDIFAGVVIFATAFLVFSLSPLHQVSDSNYSMMLSQSLLEQQSFALDHYSIPHLAPVEGDYTYKNGEIYQIEQVKNHLYYFFPQGSSVLSVPYVALANLFGISAVNADGTYNPAGEIRMETGLAALLTAFVAAVFFATSRLVLSLSWSIVIAIGAAFGTQVWSTASRGMWSHTWAIALIAVVVYLLLAAATERSPLKAIVLATLLAWAYFVRPTSNVSVIGIAVYIFVLYRSELLPFLATGAVWFAAFVAYSIHLYGKPLPSYYAAGRLSFRVLLPALAGHLISPSRGLLIYVPVLCFAAYVLVRYRHCVRYRALLWLALGIILGHLTVISGFVHWWGGFCYGARMSTDLVPWFVLLTIVGVQAMRACRAQLASDGVWTREAAAGLLLLIISIFINARGAIARDTETWNVYPIDVDQKPSRLWDWREPQMLAGLIHPPMPAEFPIFDKTIDLSSPNSWQYLWYGWSAPEGQLRWTEGNEATIVFRLSEVTEKMLQIKLVPFVVPSKHTQQRLNLAINNRSIATLVLTEREPQVHGVLLPRDALGEKNILVLGLPDAITPRSIGVNDDIRVLGVAVSWMHLSDVDGTSR